MKKIIVIATLLFVATAVGIAWRAHARVLAAQARLSMLRSEQAKLDAGIAEARGRIMADKDRERALAAKERQARQVAATKPPVVASDATSDPAHSLDKYLGLRALFQHSVAGKLALRYGAFYRMAHLTPDQIQKFEQAMTEADETKMDFELAAQAQGFNPSDSALANLRTQGEAKLKAALIDALGATAYAEYKQYRRVEPLTTIIGDMTTLAVQHEDPFTAAQADRLMSSIANASSSYQQGGKAEALTVDWSQVLIESRPYLSAQQFAVVRQEGDMQQVYQLLKEFYVQRNAGGG